MLSLSPSPSLGSSKWRWQQNGGWVVVRSGEQRQASVLYMARTSRKRESVQDPQKSMRAIWPESKSLVEGAVGSDVSRKRNVLGKKVQEGLRRAWSMRDKRVLVTTGKRDLPKPSLET